MTNNPAERGIGAALAAVLPQDGLRWWQKPHLVYLNFCLWSLFLFSSANGYDGSMMNGLQALPQWQEALHHPKGAWLGFLNAVQSLGAFCCYPVIAWSNNRFGRKKTVAVGYFWLVIGTALQTAAQNPTMFVLGRLCIGGASSFWSASVPLLMTETAYPTHRANLTALYNCGWYVGSLLAAWVTYGTRNYDSYWAWRIPSVCQICIPVAALPGFLMAKESPRWLISKGRHEEARAFLIKYHGGGDQVSPLADFEFNEISSAIELEDRIKAETSYRQMFATKGNRHRSFITITLGVFAQWNGVGIASYYLAPVLLTVGITSVTDQTMISGFLQVWNLILAVSAAFLVDRLGRRPLFLVSCFGMLACYVFISALSGSFANTGNAATGIAVIPFLFLYYGFYDIAFTPLLVSYTCEIWNYTYRARGLAMNQWSTALAVFFNIFVNPIALGAIQWKYYIVYVAILVVITTVVWFFYPETRGHSLEEMAHVFDGSAAAVPDAFRIKEEAQSRASVDHDVQNKSGAMAHVEQK
ncbi:uncharacterized protein HMPREF1541_06929 [Cyphellophora europaea CBS 101466]|uniref:Major facilitator superfamily (MFS) profile domain-containing protein n=1 Tax=Cyphellophora europaea (strain CBS 101466) TaxID=1220924 RepID=W2RT35_CYPE1|nr:uncharacterized protein HMPREF1541_06929 [Cyphellophora europaea CBS 101466]ETN38888.1 hypothetical protein HMPREF1541_06929 [Cyphellophora europaea CBS 101466]